MRKEPRQESISQLDIVPNGGYNYSQSEENIGDNELTRAVNVLYDYQTDVLYTRPGTVAVTGSALSEPLRKIYLYEQSAVTAYLIGASGATLYQMLVSSSVTAWTAIGTINNTPTPPGMVTMNARLVIADGSTTLKEWDGTTLTASITGSPAGSTLAVIKNRIASNHVTESDSVYLSEVGSTTGWNTSTTAVGVKAGFGDNLFVNAFAVLPGNDDLIISKKGSSGKRVYRLNVSDPTTSGWSCVMVNEKNAAMSTHAMIQAFNGVYFMDTNGFKSLAGVQQYGDLAVDPVGIKINERFTGTQTFDELYFSPRYSTLFIMMADRVWCFSPGGNQNPRFTDMTFAQGRIRSMCHYNNTIYLAGNDGYLYQFSEAVDDDQTAFGTATVPFTSSIKTKFFSTTDNLILRKVRLKIIPKLAGNATLGVLNDSDSAVVQLKALTLKSEGDLLYEATGKVNDATGYLADSSYGPYEELTRNRVRGSGISFIVSGTSGRFGLERIKAEVALVGGK